MPRLLFVDPITLSGWKTVTEECPQRDLSVMWAVHNLALAISAAHPCSNARAVTFPIPHFVETQTLWGALPPPLLLS